MDYSKFDMLCEKYYDEISFFVKRKINYINYHDACDITNKIFLKLTERKDTIIKLNETAARKFIYSTATNCCMQYFQETMNRNCEIELDDNLEIPVETVAEENIKNIIEILQNNLPTLTEKEMNTFREHWLKNRKLFEIAEEIHISYNSIRQLNSKLISKLSKIVRKELHK